MRPKAVRGRLRRFFSLGNARVTTSLRPQEFWPPFLIPFLIRDQGATRATCPDTLAGTNCKSLRANSLAKIAESSEKKTRHSQRQQGKK